MERDEIQKKLMSSLPIYSLFFCFFFNFYFLVILPSLWDLSYPIKPEPFALDAWSVNHWTAGDIPDL